MEREAKKSAFAPRKDLRADIEEHGRRRRGRAGLQHLDDACLLDDEQPVGAVSRVADKHRIREPGRNRSELNLLSQRRGCRYEQCNYGEGSYRTKHPHGRSFLIGSQGPRSDARSSPALSSTAPMADVRLIRNVTP
jgi:hypothetical protein